MCLPRFSEFISSTPRQLPAFASSSVADQSAFEQQNAPQIDPRSSIEPPTTLSRIQTTADRLRLEPREALKLSLEERGSRVSFSKSISFSPEPSSNPPITKVIKIIHALSLMLNEWLPRSMYTEHDYDELTSLVTVEYKGLENGRLSLLIDERYDRLIYSIFRSSTAKKPLDNSTTYAWWRRTESTSIRVESSFDNINKKTLRYITVPQLFENLYIRQLYEDNRDDFRSTIAKICKLMVTDLGFQYIPNLNEDGSLNLNEPLHRCATLPDQYSNIDEFIQNAISRVELTSQHSSQTIEPPKTPRTIEEFIQNAHSHLFPTSTQLSQAIEASETPRTPDEPHQISSGSAKTSASRPVFSSLYTISSTQISFSITSSQWTPLPSIDISITKPIKMAHALSFVFSNPEKIQILSLENGILHYSVSDQDDRLIHLNFSRSEVNDLRSRNQWWALWSKDQTAIKVSTIITPHPGIVRAIQFPSLFENLKIIRIYKDNPDQFKEILQNILNRMVQKIETSKIQMSQFHDPSNCPKIFLSIDYPNFESFVRECVNQFVQTPATLIPRALTYGQPLLSDRYSSVHDSSSRRFIRPSLDLQPQISRDPYFR